MSAGALISLQIGRCNRDHPYGRTNSQDPSDEFRLFSSPEALSSSCKSLSLRVPLEH